MQRSFDRLGEHRFDLLIIGGGIFGACAAWDATLRGLSVALVERTDFGAGTSANSYKIVHGGIRYLQHGDLLRLRASCRARTAMLRVAPHLVTPLPIVIPTYGLGREGKGFLGTGMLLYDLLTLDRNFGAGDARRRIPLSRFLSAADVRGLFPDVRSERLTGAAVFCDGQIYNPTRLVLAFIRSAVDNGAVALNHAEAEQLLYSGDSCVGARVRDTLTGEAVEVRGRAVLNAAGPWVPWMMAQGEGKPASKGSFSRDACFVVPRRFAHPYAIAVQGSTRDPDALLSRAARHLFLVPWRQYTLCGVWHVVWEEHPDRTRVTEPELGGFIDELNGAMPGLELSLNEVTMCNAGLVPFGENEPGAADLSYGKRSHIIDHEAADGLANLVSLIGVRYTMALSDAAPAVDLICRKLGEAKARPPTHRLPLDGGDFERFDSLVEEVGRSAPSPLGQQALESLARNYGTQHTRIFELARQTPAWAGCLGESTTLKAEVINAIRDEMALSLPDIVFRRTDLASGGHPGVEALNDAAHLAALELGWDAARRTAEVAAVEQRFVLGTPIGV